MTTTAGARTDASVAATHQPHGWRRWLYATNHKDIGTMYLVLSCTMWFIAGAMAMLIRAELFKPGEQLLDPAFFNSMTTMHGLIMIFGAIMPAFVGLANWMIPLQVGAPAPGSQPASASTSSSRMRRPSRWRNTDSRRMRRLTGSRESLPPPLAFSSAGRE